MAHTLSLKQYSITYLFFWVIVLEFFEHSFSSPCYVYVRGLRLAVYSSHICFDDYSSNIPICVCILQRNFRARRYLI